MYCDLASETGFKSIYYSYLTLTTLSLMGYMWIQIFFITTEVSKTVTLKNLLGYYQKFDLQSNFP